METGRRKLAKKSRIIHALDVDDLNRAIEIAKQVSPFVDAIKVSWPGVMELGTKVAIFAIRNSADLPIIADFKVADIPEISSEIVRKAIASGADGITLQGFVGADTMKACIEQAHKVSAYTFIVTEMSHPGAEKFMQSRGEEIAKMARELGSDGIVAPATRPERTRRYREIVGPDVKIMSPGVGAQGGQPGDAIRAGADFEVIGRRIYLAQSPAEEAKRIAEILKSIKQSG